MVTWQGDRVLVWDVICLVTFFVVQVLSSPLEQGEVVVDQGDEEYCVSASAWWRVGEERSVWHHRIHVSLKLRKNTGF